MALRPNIRAAAAYTYTLHAANVATLHSATIVYAAVRTAASTAAAASAAAAANAVPASDAIADDGADAAAFADAVLIDAGRSAVDLADAPLWLHGIPEWATAAWRDLKSAMLASHPDWRVWTDWYEARLAGASADEALEVARALIDDAIWKQGPRAVNAEIARLIAEHEALKPRPAALRFPIVDGKIDAAPLDARPLHEETARDFYDEAKRKALELEAQFSRAQFDGNVRAHVGQLLRRLGASYADARPGQLISLLRSLDPMCAPMMARRVAKN